MIRINWHRQQYKDYLYFQNYLSSAVLHHWQPNVDYLWYTYINKFLLGLNAYWQTTNWLLYRIAFHDELSIRPLSRIIGLFSNEDHGCATWILLASFVCLLCQNRSPLIITLPNHDQISNFGDYLYLDLINLLLHQDYVLTSHLLLGQCRRIIFIFAHFQIFLELSSQV